MIPAIASGDVHDLFLGYLVAVGAPIDMNARRVEMDKAGGKTQALGSGGRQEAVEFGYPIGIERIQGPASGSIIELLRGHAGRHELVGGLIMKESGDQVERLIDKSQAIAHHGFDGFTHGEVAHFRVLWGRLIDALAYAEFVAHASDKAEVV
jgi:hypothetical protein